MGSYTQIIYHIVFGTKYRIPAITEENQRKLYQYIWGLIKKKQCTLYKIGGVEDHLHILSSLHPSIALADYIKDIKTSSSSVIKEHNWFPEFKGWQIGYAAFTQNLADKKRLAKYIANQKEHHREIAFKEEYMNLLKTYGIDFKEEYLFEKEYN
ncbi:IS200/IS605 family transposase [Gracilimonas mengyeensis]|uniref:REP element-mobilizing transposase RayT n=1 Tax=Gracilimonas mengyeensis TaxID=1302730 RepID=A0A521BCL2_9BACT|nr:IS200/IS605 family transposase [Gracilimonas mengyeensis]SMO44836.1 REP element-mobilizing transposase RayT [Gracilimonas mengyeensis]